MRLLLDENLPRGLKLDLPGHDVSTVADVGWNGATDAELLHLAGDQFDALLTADRSLEFQQNVAQARVGILVLMVPDTRLQTVRRLVPAILATLNEIGPGTLIHVRLSADE